MTIKEANKELKQKQNELDYWLNKKELIIQDLLPKASQYTDEKVIGGKRADKFKQLDFAIDEVDPIINRIQDEIKIIDLLNKMNNENYKPLQVKLGSVTYYYMAEFDKYKNNKNDRFGLFAGYTIEGILNGTVEIIEEEKKIPEKLKSLNNVGNSSDIGEFKDKQQLNNHLIKDKLNEIIDYLKSKGE